MANKMREESQQHAFITTKGKIKAIVGGASLFFKGISKGTETKLDKNGTGGSWKDRMAGGGSGNG